MRELNIGNEYEMDFPFTKQVVDLGPSFKESFWYAGCDVHFEQYDESHGERFFSANAEGKVIYKILSVAEMPGRFQNRVIFKRWLMDPDGKRYNNGEVRMLTTMSFLRDIELRTPFKADYEVDPDFELSNRSTSNVF
jgi:hypothetical protein